MYGTVVIPEVSIHFALVLLAKMFLPCGTGTVSKPIRHLQQLRILNRPMTVQIKDVIEGGQAQSNLIKKEFSVPNLFWTWIFLSYFM